MKNRKKKILYQLVKYNGIEALIYFIAILGIIIFYRENEKSILEELDINIFFAFAITFFIYSLSKIIASFFLNYVEDEAKLDSHYEKLTKKYANGLLLYKNDSADKVCLKILKEKLKIDEIEFRFPVENIAIFHGASLSVVDDVDFQYELPTEIQEHKDELLEAHTTSNIYNQLNIRINYWELEGNKFTIYTGRTTYFDSLITNRAMDYKWSNGLTIRNLYQYGPFLQKLKDSQLSNHIGFNGFIVSSDGYIPFVKRKKDVSIGKKTYGNSIGASMKCKYALTNRQDKLTTEGIVKAFRKEISDELKIDENDTQEFTIKDNLIAAYRDFVEGGKPQFLIYMKVNKTKKEIQDTFKNKIKEKNKKELKWNKELKELEDGEKLIWIKESELKKMAISPGLVVFKDEDANKYRKLNMMPSATASIVMFIEWLDVKKNESYRMES